MLRISIKFDKTWQVLDPFSLVKDYSLTQAYFSSRDFRGELSSLSLTLNLSGDLFNQFLQAGDNLPTMVEEDGVLVFGGFLENLYSAGETRLANGGDFYQIHFNVRAWMSWFDFELANPFNPYQGLEVVEPLPICDPFNPSRSLLHRLWGALNVPFTLAEDLVIDQRSFSFVIKEKQNVLSALQDLFWGITRFAYIDPSGIFRSQFIQTSSEQTIPFLSAWVDFSHTRPKREFTSLRLEWASTLYKSAAVLLAEKKAIYSEASGRMGEEGKAEPLFRLVPQGDYPPFSTTNETYQRPTADFLQTNYTWDYVEEGIFGSTSPRNEDLSIIALWDFDLVWQGDKRIERRYFRPKSDSFAFSFFNPLPLPKENFEESVLDLDYLDVYASTLYRTKRNFLCPIEVHRAQGVADALSRPSFREQEVLLLYTNEGESARRFFDLHANRLAQGLIRFSFGSLENLTLNSFYCVRSAGQIFRLLITKKIIQKDSRLIRYEALNQLPIQAIHAEESQEGGSWERPIPVLDYVLSARWDGGKPTIATDYVSDERTLVSADEQVQIFGGQLIFHASVFFVAGNRFLSSCSATEGAVLRHRPLSPPSFGEGTPLPLKPRRGVLIQSRLDKKEEPITRGEIPTIFRIS